MMNPSLPQQLAADLRQAAPPALAPVGSGTTGQCYRVTAADGAAFFLKTAPAALLPMFAAEREGLGTLAGAGFLRLPAPVAHGEAGGLAYLLMEHLDLRPPDPQAEARLGTALARQHRVTAGDFGAPRDNYLGVHPQPNGSAGDWPAFFAERRLRHQLRMAIARGCGQGLAEPVERLIGLMPWFFRGYRPVPSLLHGDLWTGNRGMDPAGQPVVFDPACYYGDREVDLAQTTANGGFGPAFYQAYQAEWPLDPGFAWRRHLYNVYMVLNEVNRTGSPALPGALGYLAELFRLVEDQARGPDAAAGGGREPGMRQGMA